MGYTSKFKGAEIDARLEKMVNVTYAELVALRDEGKLIAGQMYRMTDYDTTCTWENTQVAGHPFDLVLTALDNKTLDEKCSAIWSERDTDGYFANSNLAAWDVRYCLDNDKSRFDWAQQKGKYLYANDGYDDYIGVLDGTIVIDGQTYFKWPCINYDSVLMTAVENPKQGDEIYVADTGYEEDYWNAVVTQFIEAEDGKGVIYRIVDEYYNDCDYDFKNILRYHDGYYKYTFYSIEDGDVYDNSVLGISTDNTISYSNAILEGSTGNCTIIGSWNIVLIKCYYIHLSGVEDSVFFNCSEIDASYSCYNLNFERCNSMKLSNNCGDIQARYCNNITFSISTREQTIEQIYNRIYFHTDTGAIKYLDFDSLAN